MSLLRCGNDNIATLKSRQQRQQHGPWYGHWNQVIKFYLKVGLALFGSVCAFCKILPEY